MLIVHMQLVSHVLISTSVVFKLTRKSYYDSQIDGTSKFYSSIDVSRLPTVVTASTLECTTSFAVRKILIGKKFI